ncbi:MAG: iron-sulfur cluster assembly scaffold protein, partial [Solirubrobacterales bacterium]
MTTDELEHYMGDASRRGAAPEGWHHGAAGGAPCGDLIRVSLSVSGGRIEATRFDAEGCSAAVAAGAALAEEVEGLAVLGAARVGPEDLSDALGG